MWSLRQSNTSFGFRRIFPYHFHASYNWSSHRSYRLRKRDWKPLIWAIECVRTLRVIVCILGQPRCYMYDNLSQKWPKMTTAVHLSTDNSKTKVVSSLKNPMKELVPTLSVASKVEFPKPPCSTLQSYLQSPRSKNGQFFMDARSQKTAHPSRSAYSSLPMQWLSPCHHLWLRPLHDLK